MLNGFYHELIDCVNNCLYLCVCVTVTMDEPELARRSATSRERSIVVDHSRVSMMSAGDDSSRNISVTGINLNPPPMDLTGDMLSLRAPGTFLGNVSLPSLHGMDVSVSNLTMPSLPALSPPGNLTLPSLPALTPLGNVSLPALTPLGNITLPSLPSMTPLGDLTLPELARCATPLADRTLPTLGCMATPLADCTLGALSGFGTPFGERTLTNAQSPYARSPRVSRTPQSTSRTSRRMLNLPPLDPLSPFPVQSPSRPPVQSPSRPVQSPKESVKTNKPPGGSLSSVRRSLVTVMEQEEDAIFNENVHRKSGGARDSRQIVSLRIHMVLLLKLICIMHLTS